MKVLIALSLFISLSASAQDCENCSIWSLNRWLPITGLLPWPLDLVRIEKVEYPVNKQASFCTRPPQMVDTIIIHHSEGGPTATAQNINAYHVTKGPAWDPWYMIGYSYVINSPYQGENLPVPKVTEGRPIGLVGSHVGSSAFVSMTPAQKRIWDEGKIKCGKTDEEFKVDPKQLRNGKIKANVTSVGVVVVGNYAQISKYNPSGYPAGNPRYPTKQTIELIAKLSCQLQRENPSIKNLKWHNYYHPSSCPGNLKQYISAIKAKAKEYGCEFN